MLMEVCLFRKRKLGSWRSWSGLYTFVRLGGNSRGNTCNTYIRVEPCWICLVVWLFAGFLSDPGTLQSCCSVEFWQMTSVGRKSEILTAHLLFVNLENAIAYQVALCRWRTCAGRCFQCWHLVTFCEHVIGCSRISPFCQGDARMLWQGLDKENQSAPCVTIKRTSTWWTSRRDIDFVACKLPFWVNRFNNLCVHLKG